MSIISILNPQHSILKKKLMMDTKALAMPNGRRVGQPGNQLAIEYLQNRMKEIGLNPFKGNNFALRYAGKLASQKKEHTFTNLVGMIPGRNSNLSPILLGAHFDSVIDAPCADDNATSVALNLAIAEIVINAPLERDLIIALYDAEEPPYFQSKLMGSTRFYKDHCNGMQFAGVIVTDLIGHDFSLSDLVDLSTTQNVCTKNFSKTVFMTGSESDGVFPNLIESLATYHKNINIFSTLNSYIGNLSDHHAFEKGGHPFLFFSCSQGKYYHHELDNLEWINFSKLTNITKFIRDLIYMLDEQPAGKSPYSSDPVEFELKMIENAIGPIKYRYILKMLDIPTPKTRKDIDLLIGNLISYLI